jgi:hypothetical protein
MITFGDSLYAILTGSTGVTYYVDSKIYPLVIPENTELPCITYEIQGQNNYTKIGYVGSDLSVDIFVFSDDYEQLRNIANEVNTTLNFYHGTSESYTILGSLFNSYNETYSDGAYLIRLNYIIKIR